ncbi:MAG: helix-turn-helix domain-containing protein [Candidatus Binatia bacterium]
MSEVNRRVGEHLRRLRKQRGLSLLDVEAASHQRFKASVLGAYERGERTISASRLAGLAELYRLPLQAMLPPNGAQPSHGTPGVALDLVKLAEVSAPEVEVVNRYVRRLQAQRSEWSDRVVRIRAEDVRVLASAVDKTAAELIALLDEWGARAF